MTKPDSTDAGGVTAESAIRAAFSLAGGWGCEEAEVIRVYVLQQESALATLTREKQSLQDGLDCALAQLHHLGYPEKARLIREGRDPSALEPATPPAPLPGNAYCGACNKLECACVGSKAPPIDYEALAITPLADEPAPLPGGHGQAEAVTVEMLRQLFYDAPSDTFENFVCYIVNTLADRLEQAGEGRGG